MKLVALEGQSFLDLAAQSGTLEAVLNIDQAVSITDDPVIGTSYDVPVQSKSISNYYQNNKILPATALTVFDLSISTPDDGIGAMSIENTFIIR